MLRPLFREPVRTALTVIAIALGVAVVLAIDLAGNAAAGSFRSSMETLSGDHDLEITGAGGIPETVEGTVTGLPYPIGIATRLEDFAVVNDTKQTLPLIGLDLIAESNNFPGQSAQAGSSPNSNISGCALASSHSQQQQESPLACLTDPTSVWVGTSLHRATGEKIKLLINDQEHDYVVRGVYPDSNGAESAIVMDIGAAQRALGRFGRVDHILLKFSSKCRLPPISTIGSNSFGLFFLRA